MCPARFPNPACAPLACQCGPPAWTGWALWEAEIGGSAAGMLLVLGAGVGYVVIFVAIRVLIGLRDSFIRRRRQYQADRDLPRATVVSR